MSAGAVPEKSGANDAARVGSEVGPAVMIDVVELLPVAVTEERRAPVRGQLLRDEEGSIGRASRGSIEKNFVNGLGAWTARDQIHDAGHRSGAVEGRGDALDHLDLAEIDGRNLQKPKAAALLAEKGKTIGEEGCVASAHAFDAHTRRAQRRRGALDSKAAHFVEHHDDVPGSHHGLFVDLFRSQDFDMGGQVLEARVGACREDGYFFFSLLLGLEVECDLPLASFVHLERCFSR